VTEQVYYHQARQPEHAADALRGAHRTDVCVVGAGFAGLSCTLSLLQEGVRDVTLIDRDHAAFGASGRNGGFVFGGYSLGEEALVRQLGADQARSLYQLTLDGMALIKSRIDTLEIDCQANQAGILWANWFDDDRLLEQKQDFMSRHFDVQWRSISAADLRDQLHSDRYHGGLIEDQAIHFHPYRYAAALLAEIRRLGGQVFEHTPMLSLKRPQAGPQVICDQGHIDAQRVVLCGGGYQPRSSCPPVSTAVMPISTYVMTTEPLGDRIHSLMKQPWAVYDTRFAFDYYRPLADTRLLWGGRIEAFGASTESVEQKLRRDLLKVFPQLESVRTECVWSGQMGYSRHQMPQIGPLDEQVWYAQGFGGHGVSTSNIGGDLVARALSNNDQRWQLFRPFGLSNTFGIAGRIAAQCQYWSLQSRDLIRERIR